MPRYRGPAAALACAFVLLVANRRSGAQSATTGEVKAAFLYNFARFTEWPSDAFKSDSSPFVIGIAGDEVLRHNVDIVIRGKFAGNRSLETRQVKDAIDMAGVHILYIGGRASSHVEDFVQVLNGGPVLTVGDGDQFSDKGGMINFLIVGNRVRFEIKLDATEHSRLKVSSRVLTLARILHGTNQ